MNEIYLSNERFYFHITLNMTAIAIQANKIRKGFHTAHVSGVTLVVCSDYSIYHGFFQDFEDYKELLKRAQCRFIPLSNSLVFWKELKQTGFANPKYSIIVDFTEVLSVKLIDNGEVRKEVYINSDDDFFLYETLLRM